MKTKSLLPITILTILLCLGGGYLYFKEPKNSASEPMTESTAIETIKNEFPEFKEYPSDALPPKSIKTEKASDGWHVAFVQEGSGRPILSATCFFVDDEKNIMSKKTYNPSAEEDSTAEFSPMTCSPGACSLENCHGLNIKCGSNPPDMCTEMYEIGDNCLQYAECGVQNGKCQQVENPQFTQCASCVETCKDTNKDNNTQLFECESTCSTRGGQEEVTGSLSESEARAIAEESCIKGGESLAPGYYNENSKTWWFDANLNATREGCNPACVVSEVTELAEINWRCTGLIEPMGSSEEIKNLFAEKYPDYAATVAVSVDNETEDFSRGSVIFEAGAPGGIFLAAKVDGTWQIVFDGNGQIPCDLSTYGFPDDMLADCSEK